MKKESVANVVIIIGLLVLCVLVLIAIYATAPDTSVVLLEETFNALDENKWKHEISDCETDGKHYETADKKNRLITDEVFSTSSNLTTLQYMTRRKRSAKCYSCIHSKNSTADCISSVKLETKDPFDASHGRIEIRVRICCGEQIKFDVGIVNDKDSNPEGNFGIPLESKTEKTKNDSAEFRVFFGTTSHKTIMRSAINDSEFHIYEINWDERRIFLNVDNRRVDEKTFEAEENVSDGKATRDSRQIRKPFYLNMEFVEKDEGKFRGRSNRKRSVDDEKDSKDSNFLEIDYVKFYKILNWRNIIQEIFH